MLESCIFMHCLHLWIDYKNSVKTRFPYNNVFRFLKSPSHSSASNMFASNNKPNFETLNRTNVDTEAFASELTKIFEEMFPQYYMSSDSINITHLCVIRRQGVNEHIQILSIY